jgi:protease I
MKVLIITGDAGESYETLYALHRFQEAEYEVDIAAPSKRMLHLVMHDFEPGWDTYVERQGYGVESNLTFDEVVVDDYIAIVLMGGRAPEYLRNDSHLLDIVREFHEKGKLLCSVCHGIQLLISAGLVEGKCVTCYDQIKYEVQTAGGEYRTEEAYRDGNIISAQTWQSHPEFYREIFKALAEPE